MKNYRSHSHVHYLKVYLSTHGEKIVYIKKYVIGNIYRLPSYISDDVKSFINEFTTLLNGLSMQSKSVYICRDYNIDLLKNHSVEDYCMCIVHFSTILFLPVLFQNLLFQREYVIREAVLLIIFILIQSIRITLVAFQLDLYPIIKCILV